MSKRGQNVPFSVENVIKMTYFYFKRFCYSFHLEILTQASEHERTQFCKVWSKYHFNLISKFCIISNHTLVMLFIQFCEIWSSKRWFTQIPSNSTHLLPMTPLTSSVYEFSIQVWLKNLLYVKSKRLIFNPLPLKQDKVFNGHRDVLFTTN